MDKDEQLISLETAKLAKEIGVENRTFFYANPIKENEFIPCRLKLDDKILTHGYPGDFVDYNEETLIVYPAPTQTLLHKHLREKYNLHIIVDKPWINDGWRADIFDLTDGRKIKEIFKWRKWETFEEMLEVALYESLKIIINGNKN